MDIWKKISEFPNYSISNLGKVRNDKNGRERKLMSIHGYSAVCFWKEGRPITRFVHRLLMNSFIGPCSIGYEVNHKDGNGLNNRIENLEYVTHKENMEHAVTVLKRFSNMKSRKGRNRSTDTKTDDKIVEMYKSGNYSCLEISNQLDININTVENRVRGIARKRRGWKLTYDQQKEMCELYKSGNWTQRELSQKFETSTGNVFKVLHRGIDSDL